MIGRILQRALGGALAIAATGVLPLLSGARYTVEPSDHGVVRLSWRARGELVRECRRRTPEELAALPAHMRQEEVCARRLLPYRLRVTLDGAPAIDQQVRAGGAHEDRPFFVFFELPVTPGTHRLSVTFEQETGGEAWREADEDPAHERLETPPYLALEQTLTIGAREIALVTYDDEHRALRVLAAPPGAP